MRWCKKCGSVLEFGLPYWDGDKKVINLYCYHCNEKVKTFVIERKK